ncbi:MAG TPA: primosomal protein N' [Firmicutes bacterium]|nr:primosomal protein N' [Bacillota bacterium]
MKYADVAVFGGVNRLLTYYFDESKNINPGVRVAVPMGRKLVTGLVVRAHGEKPGFETREIAGIIDDEPVLNEKLIKLGIWAADYYIAPPGIMFSTMLAALNKIEERKVLKLRGGVENIKMTAAEKKIIEYLAKRRGQKAFWEDIVKETGISRSMKVIKELEDGGIIETEHYSKETGKRSVPKQAYTGVSGAEKNIRLNEEQEKALGKINAAIMSAKFSPFLLYGITGSGKTEIYLRAAQKAVFLGKKAIILVPEIFLTPQILERFKGAFGERTAIYHSGLSRVERLGEWKKMKEGSVDVVVGTRSAVFAPFDDPGLIVVDEEFDGSYKQENTPRYNARDVAVYRGKIENCAVVLGSATPAVESYYNALSGKYEVLHLSKRVNDRPLPEIRVVDMIRDWGKGNLFISGEMSKELNNAVENGEQAIIFINRRGFANFVLCKKCGYVEKCGNCDIPMVFHKTKQKLICHYCDSEKEPVKACSECGGDVAYKGTGTQKAQETVEKFFPGKRIKRIDMDSMKKSTDYFEAYNAVKNREVDILVGTQMIAKGFDFPEVTFVGIIGLDSVLNLPDFRSDERVFQLLLQVAGRTGRGDKRGVVVLQTYNPDAEGVKYISSYDSKSFYKNQLEIRKQAGYPPYSHLIQLIISGKDYSGAEKGAEKTGRTIEEIIKSKKIKSINMLGPSEAPISRLRGNYRFSILLKGTNRKVLRETVVEAAGLNRNIDISIIVDPVNTL